MPKYYLVESGCMGFINGNYRLFATVTEYLEIAREEGNEDDKSRLFTEAPRIMG